MYIFKCFLHHCLSCSGIWYCSYLRGVKNLFDEEIAKLILLEEAKILETHISHVIEYYGNLFCKEPMTQDKCRGWHMIQNQIYENEISCRKLIQMSL